MLLMGVLANSSHPVHLIEQGQAQKIGKLAAISQDHVYPRALAYKVSIYAKRAFCVLVIGLVPDLSKKPSNQASTYQLHGNVQEAK